LSPIADFQIIANRKCMIRRRFIILAAVLGIGIVAAMNLRGILLGAAMLSDDSRPALLTNARWNDPASAHKFNSTFSPGTSVDELIGWLKQNGFTLTSGKGHAERQLKSLPCNERLVVEWQSDNQSRIVVASAAVSESGCL
jgi:hypothetical protein